MSATSIDLSQIKTDALSAASTFRTLIGLGTLATQSPTGTANSTTYLRGDFTWQTISGGGTWGSITGTLSSQTDLQSALDAKASLSGATFTGRITTPSILLSGNYSSTAWTTSGVGLSHTTRTLTDTSSTGTVATAYTNVLGGNTIAASNATTFTDYASLFLGLPTAGTNVTITNAFSLITQGAARFGGVVGISAGTLNGTVLDIAQTWGGTGTYTGLKYNVTDSGPSNAASLLLDLQVGGVSKASIDKSGTITGSRLVGTWGNAANTANFTVTNVGGQPALTAYVVQIVANGTVVGYGDNNGRWVVPTLAWNGGSGPDLFLNRDAANTLAQRNDTNKQRFNLYGTYTDAANYRRLYIDSTTAGAFKIGVEGAGSGASGNTLTIPATLAVGGGSNTVFGTIKATSSQNGYLFCGYDAVAANQMFFVGNNDPSTATKQILFGISDGIDLSGPTSASYLWFYNNDFIIDSYSSNKLVSIYHGTKTTGSYTAKFGSGSIELLRNTSITGTLSVSGNVTVSNTLDLTIRTVTYGATMAIDAALGNKIAITLAGNGTISNPTNVVDGRVLVFRLRQDATGSRIPVWDTKYSFVGDLATVTLSTAANAIDRIAFEYDSTTDKWYCISFIKGS